MRAISRLNFGGQLVHAIGAQFCIYKFPYNINREEHASYLKKIAKAQKSIEAAKQINLIPRRKRRVYDRPKHDLDTTNYIAWRLYDPEEMLFKFWAHGSPVAAKMLLQPKWVIHTFGMGIIPYNHTKSTNLEFAFEDNNLSKFLLYEYRNTTDFKPNEPNYNYSDQSHIPEKKRLVERLSPEEFWKSENYYQFRLNCSAYAQRLKFKKWVMDTVEASKTKESYDSFIDKKYGPIINFNKKEDSKSFQPFKPAILSVGPQHFSIPKKGEKIKEPKVELPNKLGEEHRVGGPKHNEQVKKQASKSG